MYYSKNINRIDNKNLEFQVFDKDKSGYLSTNELDDLNKGLGTSYKDQNKDGKLTADEYKAADYRKGGNPRPDPERSKAGLEFAIYDRNNNKALDKDELSILNRDQVRNIFLERADKNKDDSLDIQEYVNARNKGSFGFNRMRSNAGALEFRHYDTDNDGKLNKEDMDKINKELKRNYNISWFYRDKDGQVSLNDYLSGRNGKGRH